MLPNNPHTHNEWTDKRGHVSRKHRYIAALGIPGVSNDVPVRSFVRQQVAQTRGPPLSAEPR